MLFTRTRSIRLVIVMIISVPLSFLMINLLQSLPKPTRGETDIRVVYNSLDTNCKFKFLNKWCGLRASIATPAEVELAYSELDKDLKLQRIWCDFAQSIRQGMSLKQEITANQKSFRWYRLHHSTDSKQWIAIAVYLQHNTGWTNEMIFCRIAIGFHPS